MKHVLIDTDIFVRDVRYPRDVKQDVNRKFLDQVRSGRIAGVTSVFNLLEICGVLSFNYSAEQLLAFYGDFCAQYRVQLLFPADADGVLQYDIAAVFGQMQRKQSLGDAQVAYVAARFADQLSAVVTWNVKDFDGRVSLPVMTPEEFLSLKSRKL